MSECGRKTAGGQPMCDYWRNAWQEACDRVSACQDEVTKLRKQLKTTQDKLESLAALWLKDNDDLIQGEA